MQHERLDKLLRRFDASPSGLKDVAMQASGNMAALMHPEAEDEILKNTFANAAFENFEAASYESLIAMAGAAGYDDTLAPLRQSLQEERDMAQWVHDNVEAVHPSLPRAQERGAEGRPLKRPVPTRSLTGIQETDMASASHGRRLAVVTGASSGIGYELARLAAEDGYDVIAAAEDKGELETSAARLREIGRSVETVAGDLSTTDGVDAVVDALQGRNVDLLMANAGHGLGGAFLDREFADLRHVIDTNRTGTVYLLHRIGRLMRTQGHGRILVTGSIAGTMPAPFHAVYHATKAFVDNFAAAFRNEMADHNVSVTNLMPGATATHFFDRAEMTDTKVAEQATVNAADVAKTGFDAMMAGTDSVVHGLANKAEVAMASVAPSSVIASEARKQNMPGSRDH